MESIILILALLFSLLVAVLALANQTFVPVNYLFGRAEISLIILILGSACAGAVVSGLFSLLRGLRTTLRFREARRCQEELRRKVEALEQESALLAAELEGLRSPQPVSPEPPPPSAPAQAEEALPAQERSGEGAVYDPDR